MSGSTEEYLPTQAFGRRILRVDSLGFLPERISLPKGFVRSPAETACVLTSISNSWGRTSAPPGHFRGILPSYRSGWGQPQPVGECAWREEAFDSCGVGSGLGASRDQASHLLAAPWDVTMAGKEHVVSAEAEECGSHLRYTGFGLVSSSL